MFQKATQFVKSLLRVKMARVSLAIMKSDRSAALLLLGAAILGLVLANSPLGPWLLDFKYTYVAMSRSTSP